LRRETVDRRLTMRVLARWRSLGRGHAFPRRSQIDPQFFGPDWSSCVLIDVDPLTDNSRLAFVGDALRDPAWPPFERQRIAECLNDTLLQLATSKIPMVIARSAPIGFGGPATHNEVPILYRCILLPLSEGGNAIDGILGAVNYREVSAQQELPLAKTLAAEHESRDGSMSDCAAHHAMATHRTMRQ
jgi:hypothetical protein